jgi:hypothetical protein
MEKVAKEHQNTPIFFHYQMLLEGNIGAKILEKNTQKKYNNALIRFIKKEMV